MRALFPVVALVALLPASPAAGTWIPLPRGDGVPPSRRTTRIFNGLPTGAFPAVAGVILLRDDGAVGLCSGTLVTPRVVVTAAHCFIASPLRVVAAFFPDGVTEVDHDAVAYAIHPEFDPDVLAWADVALLILDTPVVDVPPMPLAAVNPRPRTPVTIVGFGQDETGEVGTKEMGSVRLRPCPRAFRRAGIRRGQLAGSLCWRPRKRGQDTCQGDSGGPLVAGGAVAGVTSGGYPSCPGKLSWNTSIPTFRQWIDAALAEAAEIP